MTRFGAIFIGLITSIIMVLVLYILQWIDTITVFVLYLAITAFISWLLSGDDEAIRKKNQRWNCRQAARLRIREFRKSERIRINQIQILKKKAG